MRKISAILLFFVFIINFTSCSATDKYKEILSLLNDIKSIQDKTMSSTAENAKDYAKSLNEYSDKYASMTGKLKSLKEKYPELANDNSITGKAIRALEEKISENAKKIALSGSGEAKSKAADFAKDVEVRKAMEKILKISGDTK